MFCFVCIGFVSFIVVFFLCWCCWLLIALGFFSFVFTGIGVILDTFSSVIDCVYIMFLYTTFYVDVDIVVSSFCVSRLV